MQILSPMMRFDVNHITLRRRKMERAGGWHVVRATQASRSQVADRARRGELLRRGGRGPGGYFLPVVGLVLTLAFLSPEWPWKVRVGANSPSVWPTMFSVTNTGTNFLPLCTANVRPTASGAMVERRDHVRMTFLLLVVMASLIFSVRCPSMNGPFLTERGMS